MKRLIHIAFLCFLFVSGNMSADAQGLDSVGKVALEERLFEYFDALKTESPDVQKAEADFMIEASSDSSVRQFVASRIYDYYVGSKIMGAEAVAIHVYDKWFMSGKLRMDSDMDMLTARIFADFNRQSLIGAKAPDLILTDSDGTLVNLSATSENAGRYRVVFFYDAGCSKCKVESIMLNNLLETEDFPIDLYAVYSSDDRSAWERYVSERFTSDVGAERLFHLWDPELDSDFQRKYGVIQTPRMFLISPDGIILGRGLDVRALSQMLHGIFDEVELTYGGKESMELFDGIFKSDGALPEKGDVIAIADYIRAATLDKGDTLMFRQLSGDMLYYLASQRGEGFKEGMKYLIDNNILSEDKVWRSSDDSLKITGMAEVMNDLLSKSLPGTGITNLRLPGELVSKRREKDGTFRLDRLAGRRNIIIFHTEGCNVCEAEKKAARALAASDRKVRVLLVNVDEVLSESPSLANRMFDSFDLSSLPFILVTDNKGIITDRYITLQ